MPSLAATFFIDGTPLLAQKHGVRLIAAIFTILLTGCEPQPTGAALFIGSHDRVGDAATGGAQNPEGYGSAARHEASIQPAREGGIDPERMIK